MLTIKMSWEIAGVWPLFLANRKNSTHVSTLYSFPHPIPIPERIMGQR